MKFEEALKIINRKRKKEGYMVSFEVKEKGTLRSDHFPDKHAGEPLIKTESEAWLLAAAFAVSSDDNICNIYVVDSDFSPVKNYDSKKLKRL